MSDKDQGIGPVTLLANGYEVQELQKALEPVAKMKPGTERDEAIDKVVRETAVRQDVLEGRDAVPLPEGHELKTVTDAQGRKVDAAIATPGEEAEMKADAKDEKKAAELATGGSAIASTSGTVNN